jgi:hypothetical protein
MVPIQQSKTPLNWDEFFGALRDLLRSHFHARFPFKHDGDVSPETLALRDAFYAFPGPISVLLVDTGGISHPLSEGRIWTLVRFDLSKLGTADVTFHGTFPLTDIGAQAPILKSAFGLEGDDWIASIQSLNMRGAYDTETAWFVDFVPYDVRERIRDYAQDLFEQLLFAEGQTLIRLFKKEIDFKAIYGLEDDPPLTQEQLLELPPGTPYSTHALTGLPRNLADRYEKTRNILLIPKVPESVQRTFRLAKRLYVFGHFEYGFFTISDHYAFLALEAAVHARWSASLPPAVVIECGAQRQEIHAPTHKKIFHFWQAQPWGKKKIRVNGKPFPYSSGKLLRWLVEERILTNWQSDRVAFGLRTRDSLSHLEFAPIHGPEVHNLRFVADLINTMFHSLPNPI